MQQRSTSPAEEQPTSGIEATVKLYVQRGKLAALEEPGQEQLRVALQDDEVRKAALPRALANQLAIRAPRLDADEVDRGVRGGMIEREVSMPRTDLQFQRRLAPEAEFPLGKGLPRERAAMRQRGGIESARVLASHEEPCLLSRAFRHNHPRGFRSCGSV